MKPLPSRKATVPLPRPYTIRFVKRGPEVPARLFIEQDADNEADRVWAASVDDIRQPGTFTGGQLERILAVNMMDGTLSGAIQPPEAAIFIRLMMYGRIISEEDYAMMMRNRDYWRLEAPWHPCLHHNEPIDYRKLPSLGRLRPPPGDENV